MTKSQIETCISIVRGRIRELDDSEHGGRTSIQQMASNMGMDVADLRAFRDGDDKAIPLSTTAALAKALEPISLYIGSTIDPEDAYADDQDERSDRTRRYALYDTMDMTRPEYATARTCWADMVVTGAVGQTDRYAGGFEPQVVSGGEKVRKLLSEISYQINHRLLPQHEKHNLVRDMAHYGNAWEQIVIGESGRKYDVSRLKPLPTKRTKYAINPTQERALVVLPHEWSQDSDPAAMNFPAWKVADFSNRMSRQERYGRGMAHSCPRKYIQLEAVEEGMIIRRLERASLRYKFKIPVGNANSASEMIAILKEWEEQHRKVRTVDTSGDLRKQRIARTPDRDIYVPTTGKNTGESDVEAMQGDAHFDEMSDVEHVFNSWLSGLGPSKLMLGYEGDTTRSVGSETTIVFARKCRQMQMRVIHGINHLIWVMAVLRGIDPRELRYVIFPPSLGTRDELVRAQIQQAYSSTIKQLTEAFAVTGQVPSPEWFLKTFMQIDDDAIGAMDLKPILSDVKPPANSSKKNRGPDLSRNETAKMVADVASTPEMSRVLNALAFTLDERRLSTMKPEEAYSRGLYTNQSFTPEFDVGRFMAFHSEKRKCLAA